MLQTLLVDRAGFCQRFDALQVPSKLRLGSPGLVQGRPHIGHLRLCRRNPQGQFFLGHSQAFVGCVAARLQAGDACVRLSNASLKFLILQLAEHLTLLHQITFLGQNFADLARILGCNRRRVAFNTPVYLEQPLGQGRTHQTINDDQCNQCDGPQSHKQPCKRSTRFLRSHSVLP